MNFLKKQLHIILLVFVFSLLAFQLVLVYNVHKPVNGMERKAALRELELLFNKTWMEFLYFNQTNVLTKNDTDILITKSILVFDSLLKEKKNSEVLDSDFSIEYELILTNKNQSIYKGFWYNLPDSNSLARENEVITINFNNSFNNQHVTAKIQVLELLDRHTNQINRMFINYTVLVGLFLLVLLLMISRWHTKRMENIRKIEYIHGVTHELKSTLTTIILASDFLVNNKNTQKESEYKTVINDEAMKMQSIVTQMLNLAVYEKGELKTDFKFVKVSELMNEVLKPFLVKIQSRNGQINVKDSNCDAVVFGDKMLLKMVFSNLIDNAIKYSNSTPEITISTESDNDFCIVKIKDNGIGIPKHNQKLIFKQMYRVDSSTTNRVSGIGMGLYFVKQIIKIHKGKIIVNSELNKGSEFSVYLPKHD